MKTNFVFNDLLVLEEFCNSRCQYCGGFYPTEFVFRPDADGKLKMPHSWKEKIAGDNTLCSKISANPTTKDFFSLALDVLDHVDQIADCSILKLSGGEIFLHKDIVNFVKKIHNRYTAIQLLTNSMALTEDQIDQLSKLENVYFQFSLDGTTGETNASRTRSDQVVNKILSNAKRILDKGMGLEINCVLTKYNTDKFGEMLDYFKNSKNLTIAPRPVRGEPRSILDFGEDQIQLFEKTVIDKYSSHEDILPPKPYLDQLVSLMKNRARNWSCYVPFFVFGEDNYGNIGTCTRSDELPSIGNIFKNPKEIAQKLESRSYYDPKKLPTPCEYCIIQYEIMNLFAEDEINENELRRIPSYRFDEVIEKAKKIKKELGELKMLSDNS
ncbi:MAG: Radical SAM domain protein [candidate division TM6 bacterium GW2011_GWF2_37_49]|nr:MAG: Radical SAM domain protein [candidate division TM6 bacterium GW2011_GWF2_37_49]